MEDCLLVRIHVVCPSNSAVVSTSNIPSDHHPTLLRTVSDTAPRHVVLSQVAYSHHRWSGYHPTPTLPEGSCQPRQQHKDMRMLMSSSFLCWFIFSSVPMGVWQLSRPNYIFQVIMQSSKAFLKVKASMFFSNFPSLPSMQIVFLNVTNPSPQSSTGSVYHIMKQWTAINTFGDIFKW